MTSCIRNYLHLSSAASLSSPSVRRSSIWSIICAHQKEINSFTVAHITRVLALCSNSFHTTWSCTNWVSSAHTAQRHMWEYCVRACVRAQSDLVHGWSVLCLCNDAQFGKVKHRTAHLWWPLCLLAHDLHNHVLVCFLLFYHHLKTRVLNGV